MCTLEATFLAQLTGKLVRMFALMKPQMNHITATYHILYELPGF